MADVFNFPLSHNKPESVREMMGDPNRGVVAALPFSVKHNDLVAHDILAAHPGTIEQIVWGLERAFRDFLTVYILPMADLPNGDALSVEIAETIFDRSFYTEISERAVPPLLRFFTRRQRMQMRMYGLSVSFETQATREREGAQDLYNRLQVLANCARDTTSILALQAVADASVRSDYFSRNFGVGPATDVVRAALEEAQIVGGIQKDEQNFVMMCEKLRTQVLAASGQPGAVCDVIYSPTIAPYMTEAGKRLGALEGFSLGKGLADVQAVAVNEGAQPDAAFGKLRFWSTPTPSGHDLDADNQAYELSPMDSLLTMRTLSNYAIVAYAETPDNVYDGVQNVDPERRYRANLKSYITFDFSTNRYVEVPFGTLLTHAVDAVKAWEPDAGTSKSVLDPRRPAAPYFWYHLEQPSGNLDAGVHAADVWLMTDDKLVPNEHILLAAKTLLARIADDCGSEKLCEAFRKTKRVMEVFSQQLATGDYATDLAAAGGQGSFGVPVFPRPRAGMVVPAYFGSFNGLLQFAYGNDASSTAWRAIDPTFAREVRDVVQFWARAEDLVVAAGENSLVIPKRAGKGSAAFDLYFALPNELLINGVWTGATLSPTQQADPALNAPPELTVGGADAARVAGQMPSASAPIFVQGRLKRSRAGQSGGAAPATGAAMYVGTLLPSRDRTPLIAGERPYEVSASHIRSSAARARTDYAKTLTNEMLTWAFLVVCGQRCRDVGEMLKAYKVGQYIPVDICVFRLAMTVDTATMIVVHGGNGLGNMHVGRPMITMQEDNARRTGSYNATFRAGAMVRHPNRTAPALGGLITRIIDGDNCEFLTHEQQPGQSLLAVPLAPGETSFLPQVMHPMGVFPVGATRDPRANTRGMGFYHYGAAPRITEYFDLNQIYPQEITVNEKPLFYDVGTMPYASPRATTFHRTPSGEYVMQPGEDALARFMTPSDAQIIRGVRQGHADTFADQIQTVRQGGIVVSVLG